MTNKGKKCSCPNKDCTRNGNCDECKKYHNGNTYCKKQEDELTAVNATINAVNSIMFL